MEAVHQGPEASGDRVAEAVAHVQYTTTIGDWEAKPMGTEKRDHTSGMQVAELLSS